MLKHLLVTALIGMQLLSWSGGSLYLCLCGTSACVDLGPDSCHCCQLPTEGIQAGCHDETCGRQHHCAEGAALVRAQDEDCDCTHVQISAVPGPIVVDHSGPVRMPHAASQLNGSPAVWMPGRLNANRADDVSSPPCHISSLTALSSVVLRC
jgi:hypothetical protein